VQFSVAIAVENADSKKDCGSHPIWREIGARRTQGGRAGHEGEGKKEKENG
jgi:hypothetical protein